MEVYELRNFPRLLLKYTNIEENFRIHILTARESLNGQMADNILVNSSKEQ